MNFNSKKIIFITVLQCLALFIHAQVSKVPDGILFQAIAKDPAGNPAKGRTVYIKNAIIQSSITGAQVYVESHKIVASSDGVFTIVIGKGTRTSGPASIGNIDWSSGPYFLNIKAAIAPSIPLTNWNADEHYIDMGTSQFWTVPFALFAARVEGFELKLNIADTAAMLAPYLKETDTASLSNRINTKLNSADTLSLSNRINTKLNSTDTLSLSNRISAKLNSADTLSLSNRISAKLNSADTLSLSNRVNAKLFTSDTSAMLLTYARKSELTDTTSLSNRINIKLNSLDTLAISNRINTKESVANKSSILIVDGNSDTKYPSAKAVKQYVDSVVAVNAATNNNANVVDATPATKGVVQLTGDLAGTAQSPLVASLAITTPKIAAAAVTDDKIANGISASKVGLQNVNNTSDANKPVSSLQRAALDTKLSNADTAVMLVNYAKSIDVNNVIATKLAIADTAVMLDRRIARDTSFLSLRIDSKVNQVNQSLDINADATSDIKFPSVKAVKTYVDSAVIAGGGNNNSNNTNVSVTDADGITKGILKLAGDLSGTAAVPVIASGVITTVKLANNAVTDAKISSGISASKVGLGNVDNTSDADKPISTLTQAALDLKFSNVQGQSLITTLAQKVNISDTASMLNARISRDTINLSNRINQKVNLADSGTVYVTPSQIIASSFDSTSLSDRINQKYDATNGDILFNRINTKLNAVDTGFLSNRINLKLNFADSIYSYVTPSRLQNAATDTTQLSNRIDGKINISDTARMLRDYTLKSSLSNIATTGNYNDLINRPNLSNNNGAVTSVNTLTGDVVIDKASLNLGNVDNTSDANKPISFLTNNALIGKIDASLINAPNGVAGLDANTKIPSSLLPPISFTAISVVANASEMQALGASSVKGTVCVRTDVSKSYILNTDFSTSLSDWVELLTPGAPVQSVNGNIGVVNLKTNSIGELTNLYFTDARARAALGVNAPLQFNPTTGIFSIDTTNSLASIATKWNVLQQTTASASGLALKVNISDTSNMLYPYAKNYQLANGLATKLNISDTSYMLSQRIGRDTLALSNRINTKLSLSDTSLMLSNRIGRDTILLSERISSKVSIADTSAMLSARFGRDTTALSNRINLKLNISDTALMFSKRFARDTVALSNRINLKLNTADTAAMLSNYLASIHTKENILNKSADTSLGGLNPSNVLYPTQLAVKKYVENNAATIASGSGSSGTVVDATTTTKGKLQLAGDLGGTAASPQVLSVGGIVRDTIAAAVNLMNAATPDNIVNYMVRRSPVGDFSGSTISANTFKGNLIGNVTGNVIGNITGNLTGTVTGNASNVNGVVALINGGTGANSATSAKTNLGLGNVDNTSDINKPVSVAQQNALDLKANLASPTFTGLVVLPTGTTGVTQALNDNSTKLATTAYVANAMADASGTITNSVADATTTSKGKILLAGDLGGTASIPVVMSIGGINKDDIAGAAILANTATAQNIASTLIKRDASGNFIANNITSNLIGNVTGNITGNLTGIVTGSLIGNATNVSGIVAVANGGTGASDASNARINLGLGNINNTSDVNKPVSTAQQTALDLKANLASPTFTGLVVLPTGATAVTQNLNDNSTKLATTEYVANALADATGSITNSVADATTTTKGKIMLAGDLGGTATAPEVLSVGTATKNQIVNATTLVNTATSSGTANTIVVRDASGSFTGNLSGNATNVTGVVAIANGGTGATSITAMKTAYGLNNIDNTSDINKPISSLTQTALNLKVNTASIAVANGVASLDANGKVPTAQLPALSITSVSVVNSSANMLALTGLSVGSVAVRTDNASNFILVALPASTLANWVSFSPAGVNVQSVNGATGAVALTGAANRISVMSNVFDIASTYAGQSSITTLGTIGTGVWNGTTIAINKGGTGATTANDGFNALAPAQSGHTGKFLTTNGTNTSWASISSAGGWSTTGNSGTVDGTNFFGTTDAQPLNYQIGGIVSGRFDVNAVSGQSTLGYGAGYSLSRNLTNSYGTKNTGFGYQAFYNTTFGNENTALGYQALLTNVSGASSTAVGYQAMSNANSAVNSSTPLITYNTAVGYQALQGSATAASNTGTNNTATGYQALKNTTSGYGNSSYGVSALTSNTTGAYNTGMGFNALINSTTGNYNVGVGMYALRNISTGGNNVGIGYNTMSSNNTGSNNVAIGFSANIGEGVSNGIAIGQGSTNSTSNSIVLGNGSITRVSTSGAFVTSNNTNATSVSTGSIIASGGAGIARDVYVGGLLNTAGTSSTVGRASFSGGITATSTNVNTIDNVVVVNASSLAATSISGITNITNATASSSTTSGALIVSGGVGIVGSTNIGGAATMASSLTVGGTTTLNSISYGTTPATNNNSTQLATTAYVMNTLASPANGFAWSTTGNAGMTDGSKFFGTTDAQPLNYQIGGIVSGRFDVNAVSGQSTLGYGAGYSLSRNLTNSYGTKNTGFGYQAFYNTTFGNENTALGYQALLTNVSGASSTAVGYQAMSNANSAVNSSTPLITYNTAVGYQALQGSATAASNTGTNNTATGYQALKNTTSGYGNSSYGVSALTSNTTGAYNTGMGFNALINSTTGNYNVGVGMYALRNISTGGNNVGIGYNTMSSNNTGSNNVAIGFSANIGEGVSNGIAIGQGSTNSTSNSIVLGNGSITRVSTSGAFVTSNNTNATSVSTGSIIASGGAGIARDVYVGGLLNTAGTSSTVGRASFSGGITATSTNVNTIDNVVVVNASSLAATSISGITNITNATASSSTTSGALIVSGGVGIVGSTNIGGAATMASSLTVGGTTTLNSISYGTTPATNNNSTQLATTAYVMNTLASPANGFAWSTTGNAGMTDGSKFFGTTDAQPLNYQIGGIVSGRFDVNAVSGQSTLGYGAGYSLSRNLTNSYGTKNTGFGYQAFYNTTFGNENTALGYQALLTNVSGASSTAVGYQAMSNANSAVNSSTPLITYNTAVGYQALQGSATAASNTGTNNTATGYQALKNTTSGYGNSSYGVSALTSNTTGAYNTGMGFNALINSTTGNYNVGVGMYALRNISTGGNNVGIGYNTMSSNNTGSNNVAIGFSANIGEGVSNGIAIGQGSTNSTSNSIVLGNGSITRVSTSGAFVTSNNTNATSVSTGSIIASGGAGIARDVYVGGLLNTAGTSSTVGRASFSGGITATSTNVNTIDNVVVVNASSLAATSISGITNITNATASSSTTSGALIVSGGVGIVGSTNIGGAATMASSLTVGGTTTLNSISYGTTPATNNNSTQLATTAYVMNTLASPANGFAWSTTGNAGMTDGSKFFGTTDAQPLNYQIGGIVSGRFDVNAVSGQSTLGYGAGYSLSRNLTNSYGTKNTGFGYQAFYNTTFGNENTALGYQALLTNVSGASSTAVGYQAMSNANSAVNSSTPLITYNTAVGYQALQGSATAASNTGTNNTATGYQALKNTTSGYGNSSYGVSALTSNTTGAYNTGMGFNALINSTTGNYNVGVGMYALRNISTGGNNVGIGYNTMSSNNTGSNNVAIGFSANIGEGVSNGIAIGQGSTNSTSNSIVLGNGSITRVSTSGAFVTSNNTNATSVSTGSIIASGGAGIARDVYVGGLLNTAGTSSTVGRASFSGGITATSTNVNTIDNVVVVNASSLAATSISGITNITNATASSSTTSGALIVSGGVGIVGSTNIGGAATMASSLTVGGTTTLNSISYGTTPATNNNSTQLATTAYVMNTLASPANGFAWSTTGNAGMTDGSKFFGTTDAQPLNYQIGGIVSGRFDVNAVSGQSTLGYGAGYSLSRNLTNSYGTKNTGFGYQAFYNTTFGNENTALGYQALLTNVSGASSTAVGYQAMSNANSAVNSSTPLITYNTAVGYQALQGSATAASNTGTNNTATGYQALKNTTSGYGNSSYGVSALTSNTTGAYNTGMGFNALINSTTGNYNVGVGMYALRNISTGGNNVGIGYNTMSSNNTGSNNVAIGFSANIGEGVSNGIAIGQGSTNSTSNSIVLGNGSITRVSTSGTIVTTNDINAKHIKGNSGALSIAASTGAGTSPSAVSVTGTDMSGVVALTTGTSPSINAVLATITYNTAFSSAPVVVITPANAATASLAATQAVWVNITTTGFTINTNGTAVGASIAYKWNYVVIQ